MAENKIKISELPVAENLGGSDLVMVTQENESVYISKKTTTSAIANEINKNITYTGLDTTAKTVVGAINEAAAAVQANPEGTPANTLTKVKIGNVDYNIVDTGSIVTVNPTLSSGTEVGRITVDNSEEILYAPTPTEVVANPSATGTATLSKLKVGSTTYNVSQGGGSTVTVSQTLSSGTEVAGIIIDGNETKLYAPTPTNVVANPQGTPTDELQTIQIGNTIYEIVGGGSSWTDVTGTLTAGQTSLTLTNSAISENSTFDFYTSKFGVNPTDVELINSVYNFTEFMNGKIVIREHKTDTTDKKLFFIGLEKDATDIGVTDTSLLEYLSDITNNYKKASYSYSDETTRNGNIGFYNLGNGIKLRSWVTNWTQTLAGTFYGMIDLNEAPSSASSTEGQTNTYSDPYDVSSEYALTLTFDEQSTDLDVKVRITNETN